MATQLCCFFTHPASPALYTLSLHDALPISALGWRLSELPALWDVDRPEDLERLSEDMRSRSSGRSTDRKSTRLNSSHLGISYAVFCLKKKKEQSRDRRA